MEEVESREGAVQVKQPEALMLEAEADWGGSARMVEEQKLEELACERRGWG